jgi:lipoyl-dependent peroxiredoxin
VSIGTLETGGFGLAVELDVHAPSLDDDAALALVEKAHQVCPYSNATRGNVEVRLAVV